jgi:hypothetical protein
MWFHGRFHCGSMGAVPWFHGPWFHGSSIVWFHGRSEMNTTVITTDRRILKATDDENSRYALIHGDRFDSQFHGSHMGDLRCQLQLQQKHPNKR